MSGFPPSRIARCLAIVLAPFLATCGGDATSPLTSASLTIIGQPTASDTILARPAQALVLEVRGADGKPRPRTTVRFSVLPTTDPKRSSELSAGVGAISGTTYGSFVVDSTGSDGRVKVLVAFGTVAGPAGIAIHVPEFGILDTLALTVRPGAAATLLLGVRDTLVLPGTKYPIGAFVADRFKNPVTEPVTFTSASPILSVDDAGTVTASAAGRSYVVVRSKTVTDTSRVSIVAPSRVVWFRSGIIGISNIDGTNSTTLTTISDFSASPHASPGGQQIAYYEHNPGESSTISVVSTTQSPRVIAQTGGPAWPRWSADGQWIYFSARRTGGGMGVSRIHADGTGLQTIGPTYIGATYNTVGVSPDGQTVVVRDQLTLVLIDVGTGAIQRINSACDDAQFSPDGQRIACIGAGNVRVLNRDGSNDRSVVTRFAELAGGVEWSPDGAWLLIKGPTYPELISVTDGSVVALTKFGGFQLQTAFVP